MFERKAWACKSAAMRTCRPVCTKVLLRIIIFVPELIPRRQKHLPQKVRSRNCMPFCVSTYSRVLQYYTLSAYKKIFRYWVSPMASKKRPLHINFSFKKTPICTFQTLHQLTPISSPPLLVLMLWFRCNFIFRAWSGSAINYNLSNIGSAF